MQSTHVHLHVHVHIKFSVFIYKIYKMYNAILHANLLQLRLKDKHILCACSFEQTPLTQPLKHALKCFHHFDAGIQHARDDQTKQALNKMP